MLDDQAAKALAKLNVTPIENPLEELRRLAGQVTSWKDQAAKMVNELQGDMRYKDEKGAEQLRSEIVIWERALDRCVTTLAVMAKLDIDDRLARIEQAKVDMVFTIIEKTFEDLGLTDRQKAKLRKGFHENFQMAVIEGKIDGEKQTVTVEGILST
jgi:hypothetical protein